MNRAVVVSAMVAALVLSVFGLGLAMGALGSWTDLHPSLTTLVWAIWDLLVLAVAAVLVWQWVRYRRDLKDGNTTTTPN